MKRDWDLLREQMPAIDGIWTSMSIRVNTVTHSHVKTATYSHSKSTTQWHRQSSNHFCYDGHRYGY